jgi:hypothetical protein
MTENIKYLWRRHRDLLRMTKSRTVPLTALEGQPFVYYPLHTEPETALQTVSPEYFNQLSAIATLSRDLPAGAMLAVKETFAALGRRPTDFYDQIGEFKNVIMLDMTEFGLKCAQKANATATITGTGGFEAAVSGRPVISFGQHNLYNFLPHVFVVKDDKRLKDDLHRIFEGEIDTERANLDGRRFLQAIIDTSFDLDNYEVMRPEAIEGQAAHSAYKVLVGSVMGAGRHLSMEGVL